jgi:hypothetical protein
MDPANQPYVAAALKVFQCPATAGYPRTTTGFSPNKRYAEVSTGASDYNAVASAHGEDNLGAWDGRSTSWNNGGVSWFLFEWTKPAALAHVADGASNTTMLVEQAQRPYWWSYATFTEGCERPCFIQGDGAGGGWAIPNTYMDASNYSINSSNVTARYSYHSSGAQQVMLDGSVHFLSEGTLVNILRALDSRAGGEPIDSKAWR